VDIGIDLGTTFSVIAVNGQMSLADGYPPPIYLDDCDVTIIPTPYGEPTFPSVLIDDPGEPGGFLFGSDALQKSEEGFSPVMFSKRKIGTGEAIPLLSGTIVAREVAREFLRYLKRCAEQALGCPVSRAVVTHPAYFDRSAVGETREAAHDAGFDMSLPDQMLMEPVAAALVYTRADPRDPLHVLTYDLGGGTLDVTYLVRSSGVIDMRAFGGDHLLGGYNFDRELVHWLRQRLAAQGRRIVLDENEPADRGRLSRLLRLAEQVKIALAGARSSTVPIDFRCRDVLVDVEGKPVQVNERITRDQFVELIQPCLDRTIECCRRVLTKAGVDASTVDEVLLVGGSTAGPWVAEAIQRAFPDARPKLFHPDLCVGAGAAIHARMTLPPEVRTDGFKLVLDIPEMSVLELVNVAGRLTGEDDRPVTQPLEVCLRLPSGELVGPQPLDPGGGFLFEHVVLSDELPNDFILSFRTARGRAVFEHAFSVAYQPAWAETSTVTTVLPRPLFILTFDGLVPLAAEGATLPAKIAQTFQRDNDNPNITLELFQEQDPIGHVRIENIPPEGGRGSFVDLEVELTEKNQIRGQAVIRAQSGQVVARRPVSVNFTVPEVPSIEALREQHVELQGQFLALVLEAGAGDRDRFEQAMERLKAVGHLFEQQPVERQEILVALRQLERVLRPPMDLMKPTLAEFLEIVNRCRTGVREMAEKAQVVLNGQQEGDPSGRAAVAGARKRLARVGPLVDLIDRLEAEGHLAHGRRDRRTWARIHDSITDIEIEVRERQIDPGAVPTMMAKLFASVEVTRTVEEFETKAASVQSRSGAADWEQEIKGIRQALNAVFAALQQIDNDMPPPQGRAQIQHVFRNLKPIRERIERLGIDVSTIGSVRRPV